MSEQKPQDKTHVVVQNGVRASKTMTQQQAVSEAAKRNKGVNESTGQKAQVKRNLMG